MSETNNSWLAGVDGCPAAGSRPLFGPTTRPRLRIVPRFADVLTAPEHPEATAVDMPIGLPNQAGPGGRARKISCGRCSAPASLRVFRAIARRDLCCRLSRRVPPRPGHLGAAAQGVETALQHCAENPRSGRSPARRAPGRRVFEVHPELAFWRLNGERALTEPKKIKSRPYEPGLAAAQQPASCGWRSLP